MGENKGQHECQVIIFCWALPAHVENMGRKGVAHCRFEKLYTSSDIGLMDPAFWCGHVGVTLEYVFFIIPSVYDLHWSHYYSEVIHIQNNLFF